MRHAPVPSADTALDPHRDARPAAPSCSGTDAGRRRLLSGAAAAGAASLLPAISRAQAAWPSRPIRLVVNFAPGSSPDVIGRAIAAPLATALGQSVVVENRPGAGGTIGADQVAKATPDGYTLLMASGSTTSIAPHIYPNLPYRPERDLVPVAATARIEVFLVVRASLPFQTYDDFLKFARANPGKLTYGSPGNGTSPHIAGEMLKSQAGFFSVHIPYRGSAPALQDLLAGNIDYMFDPGIGIPHVQSGRLRMLAVGGTKRIPVLPSVPTLAEAGLRGFDAGTTHAIWAPAGTPAPIVERLNREINAALGTPQVRQVITGLAAEPTPMSPAELRALTDRDSARYAVIIRERRIVAD